jgi:hypothetical protein
MTTITEVGAAAPESQRATPPEYEFDEGSNRVIGSCGNRARIFGILCAISGAVQLLAAVAGLVALTASSGSWFLIPSGLFNLALGMLFTRAGTSLTKVVTTRGNDVSLMLHALEHLSKAFMVQIAASVVLVLWVVATTLALAVASGRAFDLLGRG